MSRRHRAERREITPDAKFGDLVLAKFMNSLMYDGKKSAAEGIIYGAFDTIQTKTKQDPLVVFPNAFTPNGDGKNDIFRIPAAVPLTSIRFSVYNRWGRLVFSTNNNSSGWDGSLGNKPQPAGTYIWMVEYTDPLTRKPAMKKGLVELIR